MRKDIEIKEALEILNKAEHTIYPKIRLFAKRPTSSFKLKKRP
jgi:hypothetical protein